MLRDWKLARRNRSLCAVEHPIKFLLKKTFIFEVTATNRFVGSGVSLSIKDYPWSKVMTTPTSMMVFALKSVRKGIDLDTRMDYTNESE